MNQHTVTHPDFPNLAILQHPLIQDKLSRIRMASTEPGALRAYIKEISLLMGYEVTKNYTLENRPIQTPLEPMEAPFLKEDVATIVPILRAGLGMVSGFLSLMPRARVGHIGLYRDPVTKHPVEYLVKLPDYTGQFYILLDPMMATGNSAVHAVDVLLKRGVEKSKILFVSLLVSPEGMRVFNQHYPSIPVYTAALDRGLNDKAYIVPGVGDAGDRLYGTK